MCIRDRSRDRAGVEVRDVNASHYGRIWDVYKRQVEYRADSFGIIHGVIGKVSFSEEDLMENLNAFVSAILRVKPATVKGD